MLTSLAGQGTGYFRCQLIPEITSLLHQWIHLQARHQADRKGIQGDSRRRFLGEPTLRMIRGNI
jgi:hypothetical protein